ncbi:MAG: hypothetical protein AAGC60_19265 [Acidobacteriota bacterium]
MHQTHLLSTSTTRRTFARGALFTAVLGACALLAADAGAATLDVCASGCSYSSIQTAVHAASSGDVIELAPETFNEGGIWINKNLTVRTSSGIATVDGGSSRYTFQVQSPAVVTLKDLTLRGGTDCRFDNLGTAYLSTVSVLGDGWGSPSSFGGILNQSSGTLVIKNSTVISDNASTNWGGGITNHGHLMIRFSTVSDNQGHRGGGLYNYQGVVAVHNSTFSGNNATYKGGAWANVSADGIVAYLRTASTSSNTADVDCDTFWDVGAAVDCLN